jgi:hypothetical protein
MSQTVDPNVRKLAALTGYLEFILNEFPEPNFEDDSLMLALVAFQRTIERRINKRTPTPVWTNTMKWAVLEADKLLDMIYSQSYESVADWNPTTTPQNMVQNLVAILMTLTHELMTDIGEAETYMRDELKMAAEDYAQEIFQAYDAAVAAGEIEAEDGQAKEIA